MKKETAKVTAHPAKAYEPGAILESSWGYDQTNIDYFCITSFNPNTGYAVLFPMSKKKGPESHMTANVEPGSILWNSKPFLKKISKSRSTGEFIGCSISHGWCNLWDGMPSKETYYA
jgi:hypothetical protein